MTNLEVSERQRPTAIRGAWLFDGRSPALVPRPTVVVDGSAIVSVESGGDVPEGADVVDLDGATLLPGLVDAHVHLCFDATDDVVGNLAARDDAGVTESMLAAGRASLRAGVTTVRDLGDRDYLSLALRDRPDMPTVLAAGPPLTTPDGHCHYLGGVADPTERGIRTAVREHAERGVDVVKIMASGGVLTPGTKQEIAQFEPAVLRAAVDEAHRLGLPVTAHTHGTSSIVDALDAGVDGMEHVTFWSADGVDEPGDLLARIVEQRIFVGPTVGTAPVPGASPPPAIVARMAKVAANHKRLWDLGARFAVGTDAGIGVVKPHGVLAYAPQVLFALGIGAAEALTMVTSGPAVALGLGRRKGRVAPGYDADLLAVDGDPLADVSALLRVRAVFARGARVAP